jgi:CYTH domain-containing protein
MRRPERAGPSRSPVRLLDPRPDEAVLDLFCGLGNFTLPLARRAARVVGVEGEAGLVARARANARRNGIANAEFHVADLARISPAPRGRSGLFRRSCWIRRARVPPRRCRSSRRLRPERVVYVSCHPASLARDAGELVHVHGFRLAAAGVMDMFPQTAHVESIAVFEPACQRHGDRDRAQVPARERRWRALVRDSSHLLQGYVANTARCLGARADRRRTAWLSLKSMEAGDHAPGVRVPGAVRRCRPDPRGLCEGPLLEKIRHRVPAGRHCYEVDEFLGENAGLVVAEIELGAADEQFDRPSGSAPRSPTGAALLQLHARAAPFSGYRRRESARTGAPRGGPAAGGAVTLGPLMVDVAGVALEPPSARCCRTRWSAA